MYVVLSSVWLENSGVSYKVTFVDELQPFFFLFYLPFCWWDWIDVFNVLFLPEGTFTYNSSSNPLQYTNVSKE